MEAKQTPLIDLLEGVPRDTVLVVEHDQFSSSSHPVGRLCHEAASELRAALAEVEKLRAEVERLNQILGRIVEGDGDSTLTIRAGADAFAAAREYLSAHHNRKRIAWQLERTAMGDGYYGDALRVAKGFPEATPRVRALLDRWATGKQNGLSDRTDLCTFALQIYMSDLEREDNND